MIPGLILPYSKEFSGSGCFCVSWNAQIWEESRAWRGEDTSSWLKCQASHTLLGLSLGLQNYFQSMLIGNSGCISMHHRYDKDEGVYHNHYLNMVKAHQSLPYPKIQRQWECQVTVCIHQAGISLLQCSVWSATRWKWQAEIQFLQWFQMLNFSH